MSLHRRAISATLQAHGARAALAGSHHQRHRVAFAQRRHKTLEQRRMHVHIGATVDQASEEKPPRAIDPDDLRGDWPIRQHPRAGAARHRRTITIPTLTAWSCGRRSR